MKKIYFSCILAIIMYVSIELASLFILYWAEEYKGIRYTPISDRTLSSASQRKLERMLKDRLEYLAHDSILGWTIKKNGSYGKYRANAQSIRSDGIYEKTPPNDVIRIASFGDSFTHGDEVKNEETWQEVMSSLGEDLEVMNFGVPAYGLDQAYLRYKHYGKAYSPDIVFIGFMSENINRNVNVFPPFYVPDAAMPLSKPRFYILDDSLKLRANHIKKRDEYKSMLDEPHSVLPTLTKYDFHFNSNRGFYKSGIEDFSPLVRLLKMVLFSAKKRLLPNLYENTSNEPFQVTIRLFDHFYDDVIANSSLPIIILFPNRQDVTLFKGSSHKRYQAILSYFDSMGYTYIDCLDILGDSKNAIDTDLLFASKSGAAHYSPLANRLIAKHILNSLPAHAP
jgi:hypothetical protein